MSNDLHTIQSSLATLWTVQSAREDLNAGRTPTGVADDIAAFVDKGGVNFYASLINIGRQDLMKSIYPGCAKLLSRSWVKLVNRYMETCPPEHFHLNTAAKGFSQFLREHCSDIVSRHPFIPELADYEWVELEIMEFDTVAKAGEKVALDNPETFQNYGPVLNPAMVVRHYQYPIAKVVDWLRMGVRMPRRVKKDPSHLAIYRDPEELNARFLELGGLAAKMIDRLSEERRSYADLIAFAIAESKCSDPQAKVLQTIELFEELHNLNLFIGSAKLQ